MTTTKATWTQRIIKSTGKSYFKGIFRHRQKGFVKKNSKLATDNVVVGNDDEFRSLISDESMGLINYSNHASAHASWIMDECMGAP
jgi:hypothetical protein